MSNSKLAQDLSIFLKIDPFNPPRTDERDIFDKTFHQLLSRLPSKTDRDLAVFVAYSYDWKDERLNHLLLMLASDAGDYTDFKKDIEAFRLRKKGAYMRSCTDTRSGDFAVVSAEKT